MANALEKHLFTLGIHTMTLDGVSSCYEIPRMPDIVIDTSKYSVEEAAEDISKKLEEYLF